jgi:hypothetical protein
MTVVEAMRELVAGSTWIHLFGESSKESRLNEGCQRYSTITYSLIADRIFTLYINIAHHRAEMKASVLSTVAFLRGHFRKD